jgi:hypothetical protein
VSTVMLSSWPKACAAAAQIAGQGAVEFAKDPDRSAVGKHAAGAHDGGDGHDRAKSFAADFAEDKENFAVLAGQDSIEIFARLCGSSIGGLEFSAQPTAFFHAFHARRKSMAAICHIQEHEGQLEEIYREGPEREVNGVAQDADRLGRDASELIVKNVASPESG